MSSFASSFVVKFKFKVHTQKIKNKNTKIVHIHGLLERDLFYEWDFDFFLSDAAAASRCKEFGTSSST